MKISKFLNRMRRRDKDKRHKVHGRRNVENVRNAIEKRNKKKVKHEGD